MPHPALTVHPHILAHENSLKQWEEKVRQVTLAIQAECPHETVIHLPDSGHRICPRCRYEEVSDSKFYHRRNTPNETILGDKEDRLVIERSREEFFSYRSSVLSEQL